MPSHLAPLLLISPLSADTAGATPRYYQLYQRIKFLILNNQLQPGAKLPSTRALSCELALARNTVLRAYEQLQAEGFIIATPRGSVVSEVLAGDELSAGEITGPRYRLSLRGKQIAAEAAPSAPGKCHPGIPCLSAFPTTRWRRALLSASRQVQYCQESSPAGDIALRTAISHHVAFTRGVKCHPGQIVITEGSRQAFQLCLTLLTDAGDRVWMENPGWSGVKTAMHTANVKLIPVDVDEQGLAPPAALWQQETPRLIYTTPTHQYPTGAVMSMQRRQTLLHQAIQRGAIIIEDDYDSEFRYHGAPVPAMQGQMQNAPVIYIGSFSKTLFPELRVAFMVFPTALLALLNVPLQRLLNGGPSRHIQLTLADFIRAGHFATHIGKMRKLYRQRRQALSAGLLGLCPRQYALSSQPCGMHIILYFLQRRDDVDVVRRLRHRGITPIALSTLYHGAARRYGLLLGFGNISVDEISRLIPHIQRALNTMEGDQLPAP
ncbi:PLP-dependent aminotransferase family protein [Erwinia sp. HR93]|uniref:MocR-like pyridoxine biosynthesis transcription factor PdxR n=1 Tax=Erwinia sp. HR93 TaxID=3094840 RepID=UPI002ADEB953|nr:PLP-dependent aminotransferase family protein [Erwinia sp. HR93]MEA1065483.1 PLP-dependent aminotransferase family protein [Erwinia sp. HR93]